MSRIAISTVKILSINGTKEIPSKDVLSIQTVESVMKYAGTFDILVDNSEGKNTKLCEIKDEVEIWIGYQDKGTKKVMAGFVDRIIFEKDQESKRTMRLQGRTYAAFLLDTRISGKVQYANGYSEVLRKLLDGTPLRPDGILDTTGKGTVIFRNIPLIDVVRQLAEALGWTFRVDHDRVFHLEPYAPPKDSGITLTDKDIKSLKFVKESR